MTKRPLRYFIRCSLLLLFGLLAGEKTWATHFYGADLNYTWVSGNTYRVRLTVFGDCSGSAFPTLSGASPEIRVFNGTTLFTTRYLTQVGTGVEVTPVCPSQASNTVCTNPLSSIPGVMRYIYEDTISVNALSANWRFTFTGNMTTSTAGRSTTISNINSGSTTVLEARLNNSLAPNSSVTYTTIPTPFFCINKPANYNPGAVDPNLDSLSFALVTGLNSPGTVTYISPYTATAPLAAATGTYFTSSTNGQISFTPNATQRALVVSQVNEYRNGVLVGTSMREMTFVVLNTCSNNPPGGLISNINNATATGTSGLTVAACKSAGIISFKINPTDADGDHINVQVAGLPAGATFNISGNNGLSPVSTFTWNVTNVTPGVYNFFVTFQDDGCSLSSKQTLAYTITIYGNPNPGYALVTPATCANKAKFTLTPNQGLPPYTVSVTGGTVADTFRNVTTFVTDSVQPGTYIISTLSAAGCSYDTTIIISNPSSLKASVLMTTPTCFGGSDGSLTVTGFNGTAPYRYAIGTGSFSNANTFTGLSAGTYAIHIKDTGGCQLDTSFSVTNPAPIYATVSFGRPPCNHFANGSLSVIGYNSVVPYTYALGSGTYQTSSVFTGLYSGSYLVHIKNALGCIKDTTVILPDSVKITGSVPVTQPLCYGLSTGTLAVNASGAFPPYSYALNSGAYGSSNIFTGLAAGTYTVHVRDTALCYFDTTITISQPTQVAFSVSSTTNVLCNGALTGSITVAASGGTPPYSYSIGMGYGSSSTFSGLAAGTYNISVQDAAGCTQTTTATLTQPTAIAMSYTSVQPQCSNSSDGSVTISASGGTPGYTYAVDGGTYGTSGTINSLAGGVHVLHVKDAAGCIKDSSIILLTPARLTPGALLRKSTCATLGDGVVTLGATGGTPTYTYALGSGTYGASGSFTGLAAGTYTFHVKDSHGCITDTTLTISDSLRIAGNVTLSNVVCYNQANGSITVTGTGGQTPYTYALGTGVYGSGGVFSPLTPGGYVLHVKDANGCINDTSLTITQPTLLVPSASVTNVVCNGASTGAVTIGASGGSPGYTYAVGAGAYQVSGVFNGLLAGTYTFHVQDTHGCTSDTTITITQPTAISVSATKTNVLCFGGTSGTITMSASGGTPGYTFAVNSGAYSTNNLITSLAAATYTIHTKDAAGCIKDTVITITQPTALAIGYTAVQPLCNGGSDGSITISASGGTPGYTYSLNSSAFSSTTVYNGLAAGAYVLHIKDANNCTKDSNITLDQPTALAFSFVVNNVPCNGGATGSVTVTATGGTPAYAYGVDASAFGSSNIISGLAAGLHTIHLKDANGCTKDSTISITQPSLLRLTYSATQPLCYGGSNGSITITGIGGTTPYLFSLNSGAFGSGNNFTGLSAGVDTLHLKDNNGCTRDSIITLGQPTAVTITATKTNVLCNGGNTGTVTITAAGGVPPYTYAVDAGAYGSSSLLTGIVAGSHTIHTKDVNGCIKDTTINITEPPALALGYTSVKPLCNGDANGSITILASGGTPGYTYSLNSSAFGSTTVYNGLSAGNYVLHIKDANGCTKDSNIVLSQPAPLGFTISITQVLCFNGNNGAISVTASGGTPAYSYAIDANPFGTASTFTGYVAGTYIVHLKDANGCTKDSTVGITQPGQLRISYSATQPLCNGGSNGSITIIGISGTTPYQYALNGGAFGSTATFSGLSAGVDTLHIKDNNGCTRDSIITLGQPTAVTITATKTNVLCFGGSTGTVTITAGGGVSPYTYAVDAGAYGSSSLLTGLNAGSHNIHTKDVNGCIKDTVITITQPTALTLGYTAVQPLCNGGSDGSITISASGGTPAYTYSLNSSAFSSSTVYNGLSAGAYVLHIKDANGCTKDSNITLGQPAALTVALAVTNVACNGALTGAVSVTPGGGTPGYTYALNSGAYGAGSSFTGLGAGAYTVHIKDANGCTKDSTISITQPSLLRLTYSATQPLCYGGSNGSITITGIGGTTPYLFSLNSGAFGSGNNFTGLSAGVDTLHLKDNNGCTRDSIITLGQPTPVTVSLTVTSVRCNGGATGTVTVTAGGGVSPYTYAVDAGAYGASSLLTGLIAGSHTVHVKDVNGCIKDTTFNVSEPAALSLSYTLVKPLCNGDANGSVTISAAGGTTPYQYSINSSAFGSSNVFNGLSAGTYILHVRDANLCTKDSTITITQPPVLGMTLTLTNVICNGDTSGSATVTASGGTPAYTFSVDSRPFSSGNVITGLGAGAHTIHVKDLNGCTHDSAITITQPTKLVLNYTTVSPLCNGDTNGSITIVASGGVPAYQYALNSGAFGSSGAFSNLGGGTYTLHIKDANGCTRDSIITLTQPAKLAVSLAVTNVSCNGGNNGSVTVSVSGGTPAYQYSANAGTFGSSNVLNGFAAGTQAIHIKDANGCLKDTSVTITQPAVLVLGHTQTNVLCNGGLSGTATITGSGGTTPYQYAINTGAFGSANVFTGLPAGTHILHIKDANGCSADSTITLTEPTPVTVTANVKRPRCTPLVNGAVWLYAAGGTPGYTYAYNATAYQTSYQFNSLGSGIYTFHIKDANGCIKDTTIGVQDSVFVHANYSVTNVACYGANTGAISVTPFGGNTPYTYAVNANPYSASNPIYNLYAGAYTLHVKDNNGCVLDTPFSVTQPTQLVANTTMTPALCNGSATGSISVAGSGGTPQYTYAIGTGAYSNSGSFTSLAAGTYTVHVKDANGCIVDATVIVTEPTKIIIDSLYITHVKCFGDNSGTVTVYAHDGTPPYTYGFGNNSYTTSSLISGFTAGTHVVHVKDANGCIKDTSVNITQPPQLHYRVPGITQPTCEGYKDGSISVSAYGGVPQYLYSMDGSPYKNVTVYSGLGEGSYTFSIVDSNNCKYDTTITLNGNPHIVMGAPELTPPACYGMANGVITLNVSGGVPPLTYHIVKPSLTNNTGVFDTLRKGTYVINITDAKGCRKDTTLSLGEPEPLSVSSAATPNDCQGLDDNGSVVTIVRGGTGPYTYTWSSGQSSAQISGVGNGAYWVTVTDASGCQDSALAVVGYDNCCKPFLPDAFTPNGDGKNDIYHLGWKGDISKLQFNIYNRFGERVFVSYQADVGWDGTYHGRPCDMGVYFYVVKFVCGSSGNNVVEYKGDVTLIR